MYYRYISFNIINKYNYIYNLNIYKINLKFKYKLHS